MDFIQAIARAIGLLQGFTAMKIQDGEFSDAELDQLQGELEAIISAVEYERECRQAALDAAGGADVRGDKNQAEKI